MSELISFTAGFDRNVVFSGSSGNRQQRQVIEIQLLSSEELQQQGAVRPSWVDWLENEKGHEKICSIDRAVGSIRLLELRDNLELTVRTDVAITSKRRPSLPLLPRGHEQNDLIQQQQQQQQ